MKYRPIFVSDEHFFSVGIDEETGEHLIETVITWIAWYSVYFRLTSVEIAAFQRDPLSLVALSYELAQDKGEVRFRDRLVFSEAPKAR